MPLDPQAQAMLDTEKTSGLPPVYTLPVQTVRKIIYDSTVTKDVEKIHNVENLVIPCTWGGMNIRVYSPNSKKNIPITVYFHGGGWTLNCIETHDALCRKLTNMSGCIIVSVEFRLAPENKFPAAIDDSYTAVQWVFDNAEKIGGDKSKISVAGDSSGANQAAIVCMMARDRNGPKIAKQVLIYPATDYYLPGTKSYIEDEIGYPINRDFLIWCWNHYINSEEDLNNPYLCPLRATDFTNLPPALVITAEYDALRDEGEMYANKLKEAGVPTRYSLYSGMMHNFIIQWNILDRSKQALEEICNFLLDRVD